MTDQITASIGWERAMMAAEKVKQRLRRATAALDAAGVPYAVVGGNAVAEWILHGRPGCDAPEVFVRLKAPLVKLGVSTGSTIMRRRLARAGIDHTARDGKSFHALRRTTGTRLIESGAGLPLAAQILGHARINSSRRYFALASEQLRQCCLPLEEFTCTREGLR